MSQTGVIDASIPSDTEDTETTVPSDFNPQSSNTSVATVSDSENDSDDYDDYEHLAQPLWDFIINRVASLHPSTSTASSDFSSFKSFWREKFDEMRAELATSQEGSEFITDPPLRHLEIEILDDAETPGCPCCFEYRDADIVVTAPGGITKESFLRAVCDGLYGEQIGKEQLPLREKYDGRLFVTDFQCMTDGRDLYKGSSYTQLRIWMHVAGG